VPYPGFDAARNRLVSRDPGQETCRSLAAEPWRYRGRSSPSWAGPQGARFHENRTDVLEKEIDTAVRGGLDYWAFTALSRIVAAELHAEDLSVLQNRDRIRFCLFLPMWPAYGRIPDAASEQAYWSYAARLPQRIVLSGGRRQPPRIFRGLPQCRLGERVAEGPWPEFTNAVARCGFGKPYLVFSKARRKTRSAIATIRRRCAERVRG
jgi:hypothetical protein